MISFDVSMILIVTVIFGNFERTSIIFEVSLTISKAFLLPGVISLYFFFVVGVIWKRNDGHE